MKFVLDIIIRVGDIIVLLRYATKTFEKKKNNQFIFHETNGFQTQLT